MAGSTFPIVRAPRTVDGESIPGRRSPRFLKVRPEGTAKPEDVGNEYAQVHSKVLAFRAAAGDMSRVEVHSRVSDHSAGYDVVPARRLERVAIATEGPFDPKSASNSVSFDPPPEEEYRHLYFVPYARVDGEMRAVCARLEPEIEIRTPHACSVELPPRSHVKPTGQPIRVDLIPGATDTDSPCEFTVRYPWPEAETGTTCT